MKTNWKAISNEVETALLSSETCALLAIRRAEQELEDQFRLARRLAHVAPATKAPESFVHGWFR